MRSHTHLLVWRHVIVLAVGLSTASAAPSWAADDKLSGVPIQRFHRVDDGLYRGAQPTEAGFRRLKELGVRTVVVHPKLADGTRWENALRRPIRGLAIEKRIDEGVVLFDLDSRNSS